jgi:hypothetical protein
VFISFSGNPLNSLVKNQTKIFSPLGFERDRIQKILLKLVCHKTYWRGSIFIRTVENRIVQGKAPRGMRP